MESEIFKALDTSPFNWLQGRNFSDAFVICIGAGPWKYNRRKKIQGQVLEKLAGRDLSELSLPVTFWYPLVWQNTFVNNVRQYLREREISMEQFCCNIICSKCTDPAKARTIIFDAAGCPKGSKVLSLFCRDALGIPSFPIDRHVKRYLQKNNLPTNETEMIKLCNEYNVDPCAIAIGIVRAASNMDNPDWSLNAS